jgi:hypothetical protein
MIPDPDLDFIPFRIRNPDPGPGVKKVYICIYFLFRHILFFGAYLSLERLTANAPVATVLGSIPASVGTVESEGRQMKQC